MLSSRSTCFKVRGFGLGLSTDLGARVWLVFGLGFGVGAVSVLAVELFVAMVWSVVFLGVFGVSVSTFTATGFNGCGVTVGIIVKRNFLGQEKPHRLRLENALFMGLAVHNLNNHAVGLLGSQHGSLLIRYADFFLNKSCLLTGFQLQILVFHIVQACSFLFDERKKSHNVRKMEWLRDHLLYRHT